MRLSRLRQARLASFVDRTLEVSAFRAFLNESNKVLFWIYGESGLGKSTLLTKLIAESLPPGCLVVELSGSTARQLEPLDLMLSICEQMDRETFFHFYEMVEQSRRQQLLIDLALPGAVSVASEAKFENNEIGTIAGVQIESLNVNIAPTADAAFAQNEVNRITDCFINDLAAYGQTGHALIGIDAAERLPTRCKDWLMKELMPIITAG